MTQYVYFAGKPLSLYEEPALPRRLIHNPDAEFDRPDWRWEVARYLRAHSDETDIRQSRRNDSIVAGRIIPFLDVFNDNVGPTAKADIISKYPGMYWANRVYETDPTTRYYLEAFALGGATPEQAAAELGTDPNYVWHYYSTFFDVEQHRANDRWIEAKVFAPTISLCPTEYRRQGIMWKIISWSFGWETFSRNSAACRPMDPNLLHTVRELIHGRNEENALLVELTRKINRFNEGRIKEENLRQRELDMKLRQLDDASGQGTGNVLEQIVSPILQMMTSATARPPALEMGLDAVKDDPDVLDFRKRDAEMISQVREENRPKRREELRDEL